MDIKIWIPKVWEAVERYCQKGWWRGCSVTVQPAWRASELYTWKYLIRAKKKCISCWSIVQILELLFQENQEIFYEGCSHSHSECVFIQWARHWVKLWERRKISVIHRTFFLDFKVSWEKSSSWQTFSRKYQKLYRA